MADLSLTYNPAAIATSSDAASDAQSKVAIAQSKASDASSAAAAASDVASSALAAVSDASSKATASLSKASDASSAVVAYLDQSVKTTASPTFAAATIPTIHGYSWQKPVKDKDTLFPEVSYWSDGFETNDFTGWTSETDPDGHLAVSSTQKHGGSYAARWNSDSASDTYLRRTHAANQTSPTISFWIYFNDTVNDAYTWYFNNWDGDPCFQLIWRYSGGNHQVLLKGYNDSAGSSSTSYYTVQAGASPAWHKVSVVVTTASVGGNNGAYELKIDDVSKETLSSIDNDSRGLFKHWWIIGWTASGIDRYLDDCVTATISAVTNDRYLISGTASGAWYGNDNKIVHWTGSAWSYDTPAEGWMTWVEDENAIYYYTGSAWALHYSGTYTFFDPDKFPASPTSQCDHFDDSSLDVKWTEFDPGTPAITLAEADHHLKITHTTEANWSWRGAFQTLPSGNFTIIGKVAMSGSNVDTRVGLALFEDADGNPTTCDIVILETRFSGASATVSAVRYSHYQGWTANYYSATYPALTMMYLRIRRTTTTLYFDISTDGVGWQNLGSQAEPFAAEQMGVVSLNNNTGVTGYSWWDFFYYKASDDFNPMGSVRTVMLG